MKVSVVIPAYNAAAFIADTLEVVTTQTHRDFEIIVVDDGSSDDTAKIAQACLSGSKLPWRVISQANAGVSAARNAGWRAASADWVQFLDADDFLAPTKLERQAAVCASVGPEVAYVSSSSQEVAVSGRELTPVRLLNCETLGEHPSELDIMASAPLLTLGQHLFRRNWIADFGGFDEALKVDEDLDSTFGLRASGRPRSSCRIGAAVPLAPATDQAAGPGGSRYNAVDLAEQFIGNLLRITGGDRVAVDRLSEADRAALLARTSSYMRLLCRFDIKRFRVRLAQLDRMFGRFLPTDPSYLRKLAKLIGFEQAERAAWIFRQAKRLAGRGEA